MIWGYWLGSRAVRSKSRDHTRNVGEKLSQQPRRPEPIVVKPATLGAVVTQMQRHHLWGMLDDATGNQK